MSQMKEEFPVDSRKGHREIIGPAMTATLGGLGVSGKLIILGAAAEPLEVHGIPLLPGRRSIVGWPSGIPSIRRILLRSACSPGSGQ